VVSEFGLAAYLGFPLMTAEGQVLGGFCAIDFAPRLWSPVEIDLLREFAAIAMAQLEASTRHERVRAAFDVAIHDLRTPLSELTMASSMICERMGQLPEQMRPLAKMIGESVTSANALLDDISRTDRQSAAQICDDPVALISSLCERLRFLSSAKGMVLNISSSGSSSLDTPPWVLEQVLENLLSNAIKYGPKQSNIWVGIHFTQEHGHLRIRDEGPGFSEGDLKLLYQRYAKLSAMPSDNEASTGLGLSIVKRLAEQNRGRVELISLPGESAEFEITFPIYS
jgi:signal transduction histidine kinase